jgi:hypothetical protein
MRSLRLALLVVALAVAFVPPARADYDPVGSGATVLKLDRGFLALMKANGVKLTAAAPAKLKGGVVTFPVSGGKFDPVSSRGTVDHEGALRLQSAAGMVPLKALQLKTTQRRAPFSAKAGGAQLKIATAAGLLVSREGFGEKVAVSKLALSDKLATKLGKKLKLRKVFNGGMPLGSALTKVSPQTITALGKGNVTLNLDPAFVAKLNSLFVAVNPIFPAEHPGPFTLQIFAGTISPDAAIGVLQTKGALEFLQLGGGQVFWREGWFDFAATGFNPEADAQPSPPYSGKVGRVTVAPLSLAAAQVLAQPKARTVSVANGSLTMAAATATTFNEVFAKPQGKEGVFVSGEAIGSFSFVAQGQ